MPLGDQESVLVVAELSLLDHEDHFVDDFLPEDRFEVADLPETVPLVGPVDLSAVVVVEVTEHAEAPVRMRLDEVGEL